MMVSSYYIYVDALQPTQLNDMTSENHISQLSFLFWLLLLHATGKKNHMVYTNHTLSPNGSRHNWRVMDPQGLEWHRSKSRPS